MNQGTTTAATMEKSRTPEGGASGRAQAPRRKAASGGFFQSYKPEQGKTTRTSTMVAAGALVAWGAYFIWDRMQIYQGDEWWRLLITMGIPIAFGVVFGSIAWRYSFAHPKTGDFMIATEGEMKKVSWSSRREVIGSTKVVILFTILMAVFLFAVDLGFQRFFQWVGVLKVAP